MRYTLKLCNLTTDTIANLGQLLMRYIGLFTKTRKPTNSPVDWKLQQLASLTSRFLPKYIVFPSTTSRPKNYTIGRGSQEVWDGCET